MAFTFICTQTLTDDGGNVTTGSNTLSGTAVDKFSLTGANAIAANTANVLVNANFVQANLQAFYLISNTAVTLKTNSSSAPQDTIAVKANTPIMWFNGANAADPFSGNVTAFFITNANLTQGANVTIKILKNA